MVYYQRAEYAKAQETFEQLLVVHSTGPYSARALLRLASAAEETRNYQVARESLQRFIDEYPDHRSRNVAEQKLEVIKFK
ncbi:MAG: tetratricopeptide repeat protein [Elusimicrobiota bacterium]|nr:MAG: tetratricopeptide repeat protein [Elusimicrobiota bacterium]